MREPCRQGVSLKTFLKAQTCWSRLHGARMSQLPNLLTMLGVDHPMITLIAMNRTLVMPNTMARMNIRLSSRLDRLISDRNISVGIPSENGGVQALQELCCYISVLVTLRC